MKEANLSMKQVLFRLSCEPDRITALILSVWTLLSGHSYARRISTTRSCS